MSECIDLTISDDDEDDYREEDERDESLESVYSTR